MIPIRLQLKNFMSYGESVPPLDLTGVRLAVLSGDNGNGKTALLDAMTWSLFGETRASSDDDVIRLGASDCQVLFDFQVADSKYRVHKGRGKRGGAIWELQIWQEDGATRSLSGSNARETKAKIEQLLRMDYRTFLTSGYLAQGRADEFARATVTERKKVLADILDLSRYERLEEMAKERRKEAEDRETDAQRELSAIDAELSREDFYYVELEKAQARLTTVGAEIERLRGAYELLLAEIQRQEAQEERARDLEEKSRDAAEINERDNRNLAELLRRIDAAELVAAKREAITAAHETFVQLTAQIRPLEAEFSTALSLQREAGELDTRIRDAYEQLERERYQLDCERQQFEDDVKAQARHTEEIARLKAEVAAFGDSSKGGDPVSRLGEISVRRQTSDENLLNLKAEHAAVKSQEASLQTRLHALRGSEGADCEYCGQPLPPDRRRLAISEAEKYLAILAAELTRLAEAGREAKRISEGLRLEAERAQADLRAIQSLEARRAQIEAEISRISARTARLSDVTARLSALQARIERRDYASPEQERLKEVKALLAKLSHTERRLKEARAELARCTTAERDLMQLQQADQVLQTEPPRAAELTTGIAKRDTQIARAQSMIAEIRAKTSELPALRRSLNDGASGLRAAEETSRASEREIGQFTSQLERCAGLKVEKVRRDDERKAAARERDLYRELAGAFSKKGVQALIIENALPEIETQANDLLGRMTGGGMQLRLLTQREAKSKSAAGSSIETLDIVLSDDMGTRPYEMYSGGEAFRINFALRVALSRMLARRAGAPLQTLILDEGFGTQDPRGREAIVDALHTISDEFALILVITHIDELKDQFPTRIEVTKGPNGSTFTVA